MPILAEPADIPDKGVAVVISGDRMFSASLSSSQEKREINGCTASSYGSLSYSSYVGGVPEEK